MSYAMMLGDIHEVRNLISTQKLPIHPVSWYEKDALMLALSIKYNMSV